MEFHFERNQDAYYGRCVYVIFLFRFNRVDFVQTYFKVLIAMKRLSQDDSFSIRQVDLDIQTLGNETGQSIR